MTTSTREAVWRDSFDPEDVLEELEETNDMGGLLFCANCSQHFDENVYHGSLGYHKEWPTNNAPEEDWNT